MTNLIFLLFLSTSLFSQDDSLKWAGNVSMNGIELAKYKNFARDWKLVTVRYRQDTGEYRFTYANEKAYQALEKGSEYPDGSAFAKTAYLLGADPSFPSSLTPHKVARYQIMLRDSKSKKTGGWTYALFDPKGKTFPGEPQEAALACYSCHQIVEDKRYVFSEIMQKDPELFGQSKGEKKLTKLNLPTFEKISVTSLPKSISELLPKETKMVLSLQGPLRKNLFEGTLDEIRPFLSEQAQKNNMPAILLSSDTKSFSLVVPDSKDTKCESGQPMMTFMGSPSLNEGIPYAELHDVKHHIASSSFCYFAPQP